MARNVRKHLSLLVDMINLLELDDYRLVVSKCLHVRMPGRKQTLGFTQDFEGKDLIAVLLLRIRKPHQPNSRKGPYKPPGSSQQSRHT